MYSKCHNLYIKAFIFLCLITAYAHWNLSFALKASFLDTFMEDNIEIEVKTPSSALLGKKISQIIIEPVKDNFIYENMPSNFYIPKGIKAYKIFAKDDNSNLVYNTKFKGKFALQFRYPSYITPEEATNLKIFMLSDKKVWVLLPSQVNTFRKSIKTENAQQLGIYSLFAPLSYKPDVLVYPNPVQFGQFGGVSKTLKFRNVPLGSVIEIFTITGQKIKEISEINANEIEWDGVRDNGDLLTSGLYIYRVRTSSGEVFGKIAVLR